ncbi:hypothetical protein CRG98_038244 [Punica granatum]|uniref:Uncharacterized protein n=1 Tax=Punica granatum TaxID=22663 RepID=A0A2I0IBH8_PUNGR|nr:hypothetical protein CRG98_038244 [Punica granatum]
MDGWKDNVLLFVSVRLSCLFLFGGGKKEIHRHGNGKCGPARPGGMERVGEGEGGGGGGGEFDEILETRSSFNFPSPSSSSSSSSSSPPPPSTYSR